METPGLTRRREFLANLLMAVTVLPGLGLFARHVLRYLVPSAEQEESEVLVSKMEYLPVGSSKVLKDVLGNDLIVIRPSEDEVRAFSLICTHLGCHVHWRNEEQDFFCPCHLGVFDVDGKVVSGPPPQPLPHYEVRIDQDNVFVRVPVRRA